MNASLGQGMTRGSLCVCVTERKAKGDVANGLPSSVEMEWFIISTPKLRKLGTFLIKWLFLLGSFVLPYLSTSCCFMWSYCWVVSRIFEKKAMFSIWSTGDYEEWRKSFVKRKWNKPKFLTFLVLHHIFRYFGWMKQRHVAFSFPKPKRMDSNIPACRCRAVNEKNCWLFYDIIISECL